MVDRIPCLIPGCRRSTGGDFGEWICGKHWAKLPKGHRRVWARAKHRAGAMKISAAVYYRIWSRIRTEAINRNFTEF
jgi:hypothetical protein